MSTQTLVMYDVIDTHTMLVVKSFSSLKKAYRCVDKLDCAVRYVVNESEIEL